MNKIWNWFIKYVSVLNAFLLITVIALFALHFGLKINKEAIDFLLVIAAILSTFFLFYAFKESRRSNELKTQEHFYFILENQVTEAELLSNKKVFSPDAKEILTNEFYYPIEKLDEIKYNRFIYGIRDLFCNIERNVKYQQCITLLGDNKEIKLDDENLFESLKRISRLSFIHYNLLKIFLYYIEVAELYDRIDKFNIHKNLKKLLIARLNAIINEYFLLFEAPNEYAEVVKYISEFTLFKTMENKLIKTDSGLKLSGKTFFNIINNIKNKYEDKAIQFDPFKAYRPQY